MKLHKRAESTIGDLFIGIIIFVFIALGGFVFFTASLTETSATTSTSVQFSQLNQSFNNLSQDSEFIQNQSTKTPAIAGLDILAMGWDSIKRVMQMTTIGNNILQWVQNDTPLSKLPRLFWDILFMIIVLSITFTVIGTVWRYRMKK